MLGKSLQKYLSKYYSVFPASKLDNDSIIPNLKLDITNSEEVDNILQTISPDYIVNCAAYTNVDNSERDKKLSYDVNVSGLRNLISHSSLNTKIIQISTDYVFDGSKELYSEQDIPNPISYYGKVKLEAENVLRSARRDSIVLRTSVIYDESPNSFFSWVKTSLANNNTIKVVTDQKSNPTWTWSLSEAIYKLILNNLNGLYHFGGDDILSRYDFALKIALIYEYDVKKITPILTEDLNQLANRPSWSTLCNDKIKNCIDIEHPSMDTVINRIKDNE